MQINRIAKTASLALGLIAANLAPFVATATARDRHGSQPRGDGFYSPYRHGHVAPSHRSQRSDYHRSRRHDGAGLALGIGALILGGMIAAEAARRDRHAYDN